MMSIKLFPILLLALFLTPLPSLADGDGYHWKSVFVGGASFSGKTNYTINETGGGVLGAYSDQANSGVDFAGEITCQTDYVIGAGLILEGTRYNYQIGGSDGQLAFYAMPRVAQSFGAVELWAGFGAGVMFTNIGGASSTTQNGVTVTLSQMKATSFAWTPRVGVDVDLTDHIFMGAQFSYTKTTFSLPYTATEGAVSISGTIDSARSWLGGDLRIGTKF